MSSQAHNPAVCARPLAEKREHRGHQKGQNHGGDGSRKQQRRVAELRIGRARHHAADLPETAIGPQAPGAPGQAEPDRALGLQAAREGAIVDDLGPDGGDPAGPLQRLAPHQHAAAGRRGELALALRHPGERIEHLEEEDESRNQETLRPAPARQLRHQGNQYRAFALGTRDERPKIVRRMADIGVGQQQVVGRLAAAVACSTPCC